MKFKAFLILSITLLLAACGTGDKNTKTDGNKLHIYTTVFPLYSMTKEIGGDTVEVESVYPKNVNIHSYEPSQKDILSYAEGDLFVFTNEELDPLAKKINDTIGSHTKSLAAFSSEDKLIENDHNQKKNTLNTSMKTKKHMITEMKNLTTIVTTDTTMVRTIRTFG